MRYAQNVTDVDDPLLERASATGVDWRELAASQVELFAADMEALRVLPPDPRRLADDRNSQFSQQRSLSGSSGSLCGGHTELS